MRSRPTAVKRQHLLLRRAELHEELARIDRELAAAEAGDELSSYALPADAKDAASFNRACRSGRVPGARKVGRAWLCTREAWAARTPAPAPTIAGSERASGPDVSSDVLAELGLERRSA